MVFGLLELVNMHSKRYGTLLSRETFVWLWAQKKTVFRRLYKKSATLSASFLNVAVLNRLTLRRLQQLCVMNGCVRTRSLFKSSASAREFATIRK